VNDPKDKNFGLDLDAFQRMRDELIAGDEALFERIFLYQCNACQTYLIREDQATGEDAYDASMEALLDLRAGIIRRTINHGNLRFLFTRMARQRYYRIAKKAFNPLPDSYNELPAEDPDLAFDQDVYALLSKSWNQLGVACRDLLLRYYYRNENLSEIAASLSAEAATIRKRKERCIKALRTSFGE
jgi:DNA-directed RNA polymerase specialized sigma24 family protein